MEGAGMIAKEYFRTHRPSFMVVILAVTVATIAVLWSIVDTFRPLPPRTVTMVTGLEGGAYHEFGKRYREVLARAGIELRILPTSGTLENLSKLNDPHADVSIGFLQGGTTSEHASPNLESLGTVFYEPLWFFCRASLRDGGTAGLRGKRISIGPEGSGTRTLSLELLGRNAMTHGFAELLPLPFPTSSEKLLRGEIDAALILASWESPVVRRLLAAEHLSLMSFPRADAYMALYPFLNKVVLPAGVGDLAGNRPAEDTVMLAPKASLVVRSDLHPAIQYLLLDAAEQIHASPGLFRKAGQFPAAESIDLPLSDEARRFYRSGQPFLQRYLPFWLAVLIGRLFVILIPVLGILYPLMRIVPVLFGWKMQRRIYKLYHELREVERTWEAGNDGSDAGDLIAQLNRLEDRADQLWLPVSSMGTLYLFKEHVALVRKRLEGSS
jgi:TRAP-type uncharacterized transport system substrate-binding protein